MAIDLDEFFKNGKSKQQSQARTQLPWLGRPENTNNFDFAKFNPGFTKPDPEAQYNKPLWLTGGDNRSSYSSWDSDFTERAWKQAESLKTSDELRNQFDRKDATGIVTRDFTTGAGRELKFGDVFDNGTYRGNMYESGDERTADLMMSEWVLDAKTKEQIGKDRDPAARLRKEVARVHEKNNKSFEDALGVMGHQEDTKARQEKITALFGGEGDDVAAAATGVLGGIAGGASAGALWGAKTKNPYATGIAAIAGGIAGGASAWLNRDDLTEQMSSAIEVSRKAFEDDKGNAIGDFGTAIQQGAGVLGRSIAPMSNLVRGIADAQGGKVGDGTGAFQNEETPGWARPLDIVASVADAGLSFGLSAPRALFMAQMSGHSIGKLGELTVGGGTQWDAASGSFKNVYRNEEDGITAGRAAAAWGSAGIDVLQLGMAKGLADKVRSGVIAPGTEGALARHSALGRIDPNSKVGKALTNQGATKFDAAVIGKEAAAKTVRTETVMGRKFFLDADGKAVASRATAASVVPSEGLQSVVAGAAGRKAFYKSTAPDLSVKMSPQARNAAMADEVYKASQALSLHNNPMKAAWVNAFGEGTEEAVQEILSQFSFGHQATLQEIGMSYAYGTAMGLGMSIGTNVNLASGDEKIKPLAHMGYIMKTGKPVSEKEFDAIYKNMSRADKRVYAKAGHTPDEQAVIEKLVKEGQRVSGATTSEGYFVNALVQDMINEQVDQELKSSGVSGEQRLRLLPQAANALDARNEEGDVEIGSTAVVDEASATDEVTIANAFDARLRALPKDVALIQGQLDTLRAEQKELAAKGKDTTGHEGRIAEKVDQIKTLEQMEPILTVLKELTATWAEMFAEKREERRAALAAGDTTTASRVEGELAALVAQANRDMYSLYLGKPSDEILQARPELKGADKLAMQMAASHFWARPPHDNPGSFQVGPMAYKWSQVRDGKTGAHFANIDAAAVNQMDYDGDRSTSGITILVSRNAYIQMRRGAYNMVTDKDGVTQYLIASTPHDAQIAYMLQELNAGRLAKGNKNIARKMIADFASMIAKRYELSADQKHVLAKQLRVMFLGEKTGKVNGGRSLSQTQIKELGKNAIEEPMEALMTLFAQNKVLSSKMAARAKKNDTNEVYTVPAIFRSFLIQMSDEINGAQTEKHRKEGKQLKANTTAGGFKVRNRGDVPGRRSVASTNALSHLATFMTDERLRLEQIIHLSERSSKDPLSEEIDTAPVIAEMAKLLRMLAQDSIRYESDLTVDTFDVPGRVLQMAQDIIAASPRVENPEAAVFSLLNARVTDLGAASPFANGSTKDVSVAQLLTEMVLDDIDQTASLILARDPELDARLKFLRSAATDAREGGKLSTAGEQLLLMEAVAGIVPADLLILNEDDFFPGFIPDGTIKQNVRILSRMPETERSAAIRSLKAHYLYEDEGSAYKEIIDMIAEHANAEFGLDSAGKAYGRIGKNNEDASESWGKTWQAIQLALKKYQGGVVPKDAVEARNHLLDLLTQQDIQGRQLLESLLSSLGLSPFFQTESGSFLLRDYVLDSLLAKTAAEGEMILWRGRTESGLRKLAADRGRKEKEEDKAKISSEDTLVHLLDSVSGDPILYQKILSKLFETPSREAFEQWVARELDVVELPVLMYENKAETFKPDIGKGGWANPPVAFRSNIRDAASAASNILSLTKQREEVRELNRQTFRDLKTVEKSSPQWKRYVYAFEQIGKRVVTLSPDTMLEIIARSLTTSPKGSSKGATSEALNPLADVNLIRDHETGHYDRSVETANMLLERVDMQDVMKTPELIFSAKTMVALDGTTVDLMALRDSQGNLTPESVLDATDNDALIDLMADVLMPKGVTYNFTTGTTSYTRPGASTMKELVDGPLDRAFKMVDGKYTLEADLAYGAEISAREQENNPNDVAPFERQVLVGTVARLTALDHIPTPAEQEAVMIGVWRDLVQTYRMAADLAVSSAGGGGVLLQATVEAAQKMQRENVMDAGKARAENRGKLAATRKAKGKLPKEAQEALQESLKFQLEEAEFDKLLEEAKALDANTSLSPQERKVQKDAILARVDSLSLDAPLVDWLFAHIGNDPLGELKGMYFIPEESAVTDDARRKRVKDYLLGVDTNSPMLAALTSERKLIENLRNGLKIEPEEWNLLSRIVISHVLRENSMPVMSTQDPLVIIGNPPEEAHQLDPFEVFDPTFANMLNTFARYDSGLMQAAIEIIPDRDLERPAPDVEALSRQLLRVYSPEKVPQWSTQFAAAATAMEATFVSSSAGKEVSAPGELPKTMHAMTTASTRTTTEPDPDTMVELQVALVDGKVTIVGKDPALLIREKDILGAFGKLFDAGGKEVYFEGLRFARKPPLTYKAFTEAALVQALRANNGPLTLKMFSALNRPAGDSALNSIYYDGVIVHDTVVSPWYDSIVGEMYINADGLNRRGQRGIFDAIKKLKNASFRITGLPKVSAPVLHTQPLEVNGQPASWEAAAAANTKMVTEYLQDLADEFISKDMGAKPLGAAYYKAALKLFSMRTVVSFADGTAISVHDFLAAMRDPGTAQEILESGARFEVLSQRQASEIYGETGSKGLAGLNPRVYQASSQDKVFTWGNLSERQKLVIANLRKTTELADTPIVNRPVLRKGTASSKSEMRAANRDMRRLVSLRETRDKGTAKRNERLMKNGKTPVELREAAHRQDNELAQNQRDVALSARTLGMHTDFQEAENNNWQTGEQAGSSLGFVVDLDQGDLLDGVITRSNFSEFQTKMKGYLGDFVVIDLEQASLAARGTSSKDREAFILDLVQYLVNQGVEIRLYGRGPEGLRSRINEIFNSMPMESAYEPRADNPNSFHPAAALAPSKLEQVYASRAFEVEPMNARARLLVFNILEGYELFNDVMENATVVLNKQKRVAWNNAIIKQSFSSSLVPLHPSTVEEFNELIDQIGTGADATAAWDQAIKGKEENHPKLLKLEDALLDLKNRVANRSIPITTPGNYVAPGMFQVFRVETQRDLPPVYYLHRLGTKALDPAELQKLAESGQRIIISDHKTEESQTLFKGKVLPGARTTSTGDIILPTETTLDEVGSKLIQSEYEGAFKALTMEASDEVRAAIGESLFSHMNVGIDLISLRSDNEKKAGTVHSGTSYRELASIIGVDHMPIFYEGLYGKKWDENAAGAQKEMAQLRSLLTYLADTGTAREEDVQAMIDALTSNRRADPLLHNLLGLQLSNFLEAAGQNNVLRDAVNKLNTFDTVLTAPQIALFSAMAYLSKSMTTLKEIEGTPGIAIDSISGTEYATFRGPDMFYRIFDSQASLHELGVQLLNSQLARGDFEGWQIDKNEYLLRRTYRDANGDLRHVLGELSYKTLFAQGEQTETEYDPTKKKGLSTHDNRQLEMAMGAQFSNKYEVERMRKYVDAQTLYDGNEFTGYEGLQERVGSAPHGVTPRRGGAQTAHMREKAERLAPFFTKIDFSLDKSLGDTDAERERALAQLRAEITELANVLFDNTNGAAERHIHTMIRLMRWHPGRMKGQDKNAGFVSAEEARIAMATIRENMRHGASPMYRGVVSLMPVEIAVAFIKKQRSTGDYGLKMWNTQTNRQEEVSTIDEYYMALISHSLDDKRVDYDPAINSVMDGIYHQYLSKAPDNARLPVSLNLWNDLKLLANDVVFDEVIAKELENVSVGDYFAENPDAMLKSFNRLTNLELTPAELQDLPINAAVTMLLAGEQVQEIFEPHKASEDLLAAAREDMLKWRGHHDMGYPTKQSLRVTAELGYNHNDSAPKSHAFIRSILAVRGSLSLLNPALAPAAMVESFWRGMLEEMAKLATGESTGMIGTQWNKIINADNNFGILLRAAGMQPTYLPQQVARKSAIINNAATIGELKKIIHNDLDKYHDDLHMQGVPKFLQRTVHWGGAWQDLAKGTKARTMTSAYIDGAIFQLLRTTSTHKNAATGTVTPMTVDLALEYIAQDPTWLKREHPSAHRAGLAAMNDRRGVHQTFMHKMIKAFYTPMSTSPNAGINVFGNIVFAMPLMFSGYGSNFILTATGLRGFDQLAAHALDGRRNPSSFMAALNKGAKGEPYDVQLTNMTDVTEGFDILDSFVKMGMTHTQLFIGGLLLQGLGLSGEDEETKRRRRAAQAAGTGMIYDPRALENDFRNAQAIFLDWMPDALAQYWATVDDAGNKRSPAELHWTVKQFISPLIGMERFFETGDFRQVWWGFQDAASSMPLLNSITLNRGVESAAELTAAARDAEASGGPSALPATAGLMTAVVSAYESMLFESSFINALYVGFDEYDRDPYILPLRDSDGDLQRDVEGNVRSNQDQHLSSEGLGGRGKALQTYTDDEGNLQQGYLRPSNATTQSRVMAENRFSYAVVSSLFTGLAGKGSNFRYSMPVKTRSVDKPKLTREEAEAVVMGSLAANEDFAKGLNAGGAKDATQQQKEMTAVAMSFLDDYGNEVLTAEGAYAIFKGIAGGSTPIGHESLQGVYIDFDTRVAIQKDWLDRLAEEGVQLGLSEEAAIKRAQNIWYGPYDKSAPGISEVLWDKRISYSPTQEYQQLNTTYVMGPDGTPWAAGFTRAKLLGAFGLTPLQRSYNAEDTGIDLDSRLNVADKAVGVNTGQRGLRRVDDSWDIPTDAEIGDAIVKAIEGIEIGRPSGFSGYGRRGGGGGGGGYAPRPNIPYGNLPRWNDMRLRLDTLKTPYANDMYAIGTENVTIRREETRRQRISSERGRLKPWQ